MVRLAAVGQFALAFEVDRLVVQDGLAAVQMLDELGDAADVVELVLTRPDLRARRSA